MNKKIKTLLLSVALCVVLMPNLQAQNKGETVVVRIVETLKGFGGESSSITISYGDNKSEMITLEHLKKNYPEENLHKINEVITKLYNEGYELISSTNQVSSQSSPNAQCISSLLIFRTKEK